MDDLTTKYTPSITKSEYDHKVKLSQTNPESFWGQEAATHISWDKKWDSVLEGNFINGNTQWFNGAKLNVSYNCLDRHLDQHADKIAIIWQGDEPHQVEKITFAQLHKKVSIFAQSLNDLGIQKGDRVCIYLPMIPEAIIAMLACARIGAIHVVVFGGFSAIALRERINDTGSCLLITAAQSMRGGKITPLKEYADEAILKCPTIKNVILINNSTIHINLPNKYIDYQQLINNTTKQAKPVSMNAQDPLFILYTSGSTNKPKGMVHTTAGYLVYAISTFKQVFNPTADDIYWCTADVGWITGHTYMVYAPLVNSTTILMFEGIPTYPTPSRIWEIVEQHKVNILYTAPTLLRSLMKEGSQYVQKNNLNSLKLLGTVGEPINPEVWLWYYEIVGNKNCPIVDTWWQTETGGIMMSAIPGITKLKPGSTAFPLFGITPQLITNTNQQDKLLLISKPWPGMATTVWNDHSRFMQTYFSLFPGYFYTGDGAYCDDDGYYWITGRVDDVINVSGHRLGTADLESALIKHEAIAESAVVGYPHPIKGQGIYAYIVPMDNYKPSTELTKSITQWMRHEIGAIAIPDQIQWVTELPKTRSGKILRRILRNIATGNFDKIGDISTLSNPEILENLMKNQ